MTSLIETVEAAVSSVTGRAPYDVSFYSPEQWSSRGEGETGGELVIVHDGGDLTRYGSNPAVWRAVERALAPLGYYVEQLTGWASSVVPVSG